MTLCPNCGGPCPPGDCDDHVVAARRVLVAHLSEPARLRQPFAERLAAILADLAPHLRSRP